MLLVTLLTSRESLQAYYFVLFDKRAELRQLPRGTLWGNTLQEKTTKQKKKSDAATVSVFISQTISEIFTQILTLKLFCAA